MNGFSAPFHRLSAAGGLTAVAALTLAMSGCADLHRATSFSPVNPESPVAAQVAGAARGNYPVPRLRDVPPVPKNVPTAASVKLGVVSMVRCRGGVDRYAITHPPLSGGAEQFASNQRDLAQVNAADVPPPESAALSEADAARLREFAAPPSAIASGPPPTPSQAKPPVASVPAARPAQRPARHAAAARPPKPSPALVAPSPPPAPRPAVAAVSASAPAGAVTTPADAPPLPAPLPDPLLARCS